MLSAFEDPSQVLTAGANRGWPTFGPPPAPLQTVDDALVVPGSAAYTSMSPPGRAEATGEPPANRERTANLRAEAT